MKKIYALFLVVFMGTVLFAQQREVTGIREIQVKEHPMLTGTGKVNGIIDTIDTYFQRATAYFILTAGPSGYVLGTNDFSSAVGNHFDALGSTTVTEAMVYFVAKKVMGSGPDVVTVNVYEAAVDSNPVQPIVVNATGTVNVADIDTTGAPTFIALSGGTPMGGQFFVSVVYGSTGVTDDTIVVLSSNPTTQGGGPDGQGEKRTRQFVTAASQWVRVWSIWTLGTFGPMNADAMVFPIVDYDPVSTPEAFSTSNGLTLLPNYPDPATDYTNIRYALDHAAEVEISVFDNTGKILAGSTLKKGAGNHEMYVDLSQFAAGKYYYKISTPDASWISRFIVIK